MTCKPDAHRYYPGLLIDMCVTVRTADCQVAICGVRRVARINIGDDLSTIPIFAVSLGPTLIL